MPCLQIQQPARAVSGWKRHGAGSHSTSRPKTSMTPPSLCRASSMRCGEGAPASAEGGRVLMPHGRWASGSRGCRAGARQAGFACRTMPRHSVSGSEAGIAHRDGGERCSLFGCSPGLHVSLWRALYPLLRLAQGIARRRYLRGLC
jgi:hypothetical protein